jgi:LEA14-like dessication related protein
MLARLLCLAATLLLSACTTLGLPQPVEVDVVGIEALPGRGMEGRFLVTLRVVNPNDQPVDYDGVHVVLELRGNRLASGVSDDRGTVPRFGEAVVAVPMSVPVSALVRQALDVASGGTPRADYRLRGRLAGPGFGGVSFESRGDLSLPGGAIEGGPR